jgi:hypothetical protein
MPSYYKLKNRYTYAGIYTFSLEAFDPGKCKQSTLNISSEETPAKAESKILEKKMRDRVWAAFDEYRQQRANSSNSDKLGASGPIIQNLESGTIHRRETLTLQRCCRPHET